MGKALSARALDIRAKKSHPLEWVFELLEDHPAYMRRRFFGGEAAYINGRLVLTLIAKEEPWNGVFVITGREFHEPLQKQWPALKPHTHISKWLYLSQGHALFETTTTAIIRAIHREDPPSVSQQSPVAAEPTT